MGADPPRLSVVIPALDEPDQVAAAVPRIREALAPIGAFEIVVVDDGSSSTRTADARAAAGADVVVRHDQNLGKGAAVRSGVAAASGAVDAFTDVDLAYSPAQLVRLLAAVEGGADVAVGSRLLPDSTTVSTATVFRRLTSRLFNLVTFVLLGVYRDTQCGLKAFRAVGAPA